jgi:hypothetical protein
MNDSATNGASMSTFSNIMSDCETTNLVVRAECLMIVWATVTASNKDASIFFQLCTSTDNQMLENEEWYNVSKLC